MLLTRRLAVLKCRLVLPTSRIKDCQGNVALEIIPDFHALIWLMTKPRQDIASTQIDGNTSNLEASLNSTIFLSSLNCMMFPSCSTDLWFPLVRQLHEEWNDTFNQGEQHMSRLVSVIVREARIETHAWIACRTTQIPGQQFQLDHCPAE